MNAIVPYRRSDLRRGASSVLQFASGGVAADVRVERVDRRNRCSWYALKLGTHDGAISGRLVGVRRGGDVDELGSVEVAPGSVGNARFAVTTPRTGAYQAMYLEICGDDVMLRVEAPRPPASKRFSALKAGASLLVLGIALSCAAIPFASAREPNRVPPPLAAAPVHAAPVIALANPARILSFAARRDDAPGGETVLASYLAVADRGTIALLDDAGTVITSGAFSRVGTIRLRVPKAFRALPMTAQITVHRGKSKAVSSVSVPPNAAQTPAPSPSPSPSAAGLDVAPEGITPIDTSVAGGGLVAVDGHAVSGRPLHLSVAPQPSAMHVELQDETGTTLAESDIAAGAKHAVLQLPPASKPANYLIALHYTHNGGEETVIRTLVAAPAP